MARRSVFLVLLLAISFLPACGKRAGKVNVLLVTIDTTRPDHTSVYGYSRRTTPNLERWANGAARFTQATTAMPTTDPSHMTLLTGRYPFRIGVEENSIPMAESEKSLAVVLKGLGYATAAFVSVRHLGTRGYERGFDVYDFPRQEHQVKGDATLGKALAWLGDKPREPFFLWVHFFDPHMDYNAPEPYKTMFGADMVARYDGEIAFADHCAGKLLDRIAALGLARRTAVVVASDHGEHLEEPVEVAGMPDYRYHHGNTVQEYEIRTVLLIRLPGVVTRRTDVGVPAELTDVAPTLLDYLGVPPPPGVAMDGVSLLPALRATGRAPRPASFAYTNPARGPWTAARDARWKLVRDARDRSARLVDHLADPAEAADRSANAAADRARLSGELDAWEAAKAKALAERPPTNFQYDPETVKMLQSLGYLPTGEPAPK